MLQCYKLRIVSCWIAVMVLATACSFSPDEKKSTPPKKVTSKGEPGRLVLVSSDDVYTHLEDVIDDVFYEPQLWLVQTEAHFKLSRMNAKSFGRSFIEHQTLLFLVTRSNFDELSAYLPGIQEEKLEALFQDPEAMPISVVNKWAKPQHVYYLFAEDLSGLKHKLQYNKEALLHSLYKNEIADYAERLFKNKPHKNLAFKEIKQELGMGVALPEKFELMKQEQGFFWYSERYVGEQVGAFIYKVPYEHEHQFQKSALIALRDSILQAQVPGPQEGTYMTTSGSDLYPFMYESMEISGNYAVKLRGWWTVKGEYMAGPFVLYAVLSPDKKDIFIYEGYLYAPNKSKSKHYRTLESLGFTIQ